jgi:hypothetical protein
MKPMCGPQEWFSLAEEAAEQVEEGERAAARQLVRRGRDRKQEPVVAQEEGPALQEENPAVQEAVLPSSHPLYPALSSGVAVTRTQAAGRHLVATRLLRPGELVAVDRPAVTWLAAARTATNCLHCLACCPLPLPCPS